MRTKAWLMDALRKPCGVRTGPLLEVVRGEAETADVLKAIGKFTRVKPTEETVGFAGAAVCNNVVDYYESRFTEKSLRQIRGLLPGAGMTVGHDMAGWSYATVFDAAVREPGQPVRIRELRDLSLATWVDARYYWPLEASWGRDLALRIAYGITREVSLHWQFDLPVCSICDDDLRKCEHVPGEKYDVDGKERGCFYEMESIREVIETAFVVKGGQRGTSTFLLNRGAEQGVAFGEAIREVKGNATLLAEWRAMMRPAAKRSEEKGVTDPKAFFANALRSRNA